MAPGLPSDRTGATILRLKTKAARPPAAMHTTSQRLGAIVMSSDVPLRTLTVFRAKDGPKGTSDLLKPGRYKPFRVDNSLGYLGPLLINPARQRQPDWLNLFDGALDETPKRRDVTSASVSAVLLVQRNDQTYILTFGYGRYMLLDGVVEERFGLRAALNVMNDERIRSLDLKRFEQVQRHTREQVSRDSTLGAFGLDVEQDLLSAVTGVPSEKKYGLRLAGRDCVSVTAHVDLDSLPALLDNLEEASQLDTYKKRFPWVDNIREVGRDRAQELDAALVAAVKKGDLTRIWLGAPMLLDWDRVSHFTYRAAGTATRYAHLDFKHYFAEVRPAKDFEARHLKGDRIRCHRADHHELESWQLRQCICAEIEDGGRHILSEGKWYSINTDFVARVLDTVERIKPSQLVLPHYDDKDEAAYNARVAKGSKGRLALMDRQLISAPVANGSVEFCDLFDQGRRMVHVKRYGGSSALSHLFAQGVVSARQYHLARDFRKLVNDKLPATHRLSDPKKELSAPDYEVAYAIIAKKGKMDHIPFFSMVNLKGVHDLLGQIGFKITLSFVENKRPKKEGDDVEEGAA